MKKKFNQRQIPTLLGLAILVISLIGGIALIGTGGGVFAPRAAPQTTPKLVKVTNLKDTSVTVSFLTDEATAGFIKYGTDPAALRLQAGDDRDQVTGSVGQFTSHYITLRDLQPETAYYYTLGTGSGGKYDNGGQPYLIRTAKRTGNPSSARTIYGNVNSANGGPAAGAIVYATIDGVGELSGLVKDSGSWAIPLSTARTADGTATAVIDKAASIQLFVQGPSVTATTSLAISLDQAQPTETITLGQSATTQVSTSDTATTVADSTQASDSSLRSSDQPATDQPADTPTASPVTEASPMTQNNGDNLQIATQNPIDTTQSTPASVSPQTQQVVDTNSSEAQVVTTTQPQITGQVAPNVTVQIEIHSETAITTTARTDANGVYTVDIAKLQQQLEPGEHTITVSYTDPKTGKTVTEQKTFTVAAKTSATTASTATQTSTNDQTLLALASTSPQPFGTDNPFSMSETPSPSPSVSPSIAPQTTMPATSSSLPKSGSTETTTFVIIGGILFLVAGIWSYLHNEKQFIVRE